MPKHHRFEEQLAQSWPPDAWRDVGALVAVSGGADSVALLRAMRALKQPGPGELWVGHFNHGLRPTADDDEQFVRELCNSLNLRARFGKPSAALSLGRNGMEDNARRARYQFLQRAAEDIGARFVVTAHTADDQVETILHRLIRGTGLDGLQGIPRARALGPAVTVIRPLLGTRRADVEKYLRSIGQSWREDQTNQDVRFTRNRIRHELLPLLESLAPDVQQAVLRLGQIACDVQAVIKDDVARLFSITVKLDGPNAVRIGCDALRGCQRHLIRELLVQVWRSQDWSLQAMGFDEWNLLTDLALSKGADRMFPGGILARRDGSFLLLSLPLPAVKPA